MNSIILCEGPTDAILLSYYLGKLYGWRYSAEPPSPSIKIAPKSNQEINWYKRGDDSLLIYAVGGKDNFANAINVYISKILLNYSEQYNFRKIVIIADRDDMNISEIEHLHQQWLSPYVQEMKNEHWTQNNFVDAFGNGQTLCALSIIIPVDKQGALETMLLEAISENEYNKVIVDSSRNFVDDVCPNAKKYIKTNRLALKAHLATVFAIISPEKVFSKLDNLIKDIPWENSKTLNACFNVLAEI